MTPSSPTCATAPLGEPPAPGPHHVVLVGLMGSGKTTVGRRVASALRRRFLDADDELAIRTGRDVREWFDGEGEAAFRQAEAGVLVAILASAEPLVVATGGGAVVTEATRRRLGADDVTVVWLHGDPAFLASRTKPKPHRPLLAGDARATLERLFAERHGWYAEVADLTVDVQPAFAGPAPKDVLAADVVAQVVAHEQRRAAS